MTSAREHYDLRRSILEALGEAKKVLHKDLDHARGRSIPVAGGAVYAERISAPPGCPGFAWTAHYFFVLDGVSMGGWTHKDTAARQIAIIVERKRSSRPREGLDAACAINPSMTSTKSRRPATIMPTGTAQR